MRFYCLSDTHGGPPPSAAMFMSGQIILHAGDLYNEGNPSLHHDWAKVLLDNDLLVVRGNHDCVDTDLLNAHDPTMGISKAGETWIVGIGWCGQAYNQLAPEALMTRGVVRLMDAITKVFADGDRSIVVTHYPPTNPALRNQEGWEFRCIMGLVDAIRPMAVVAGHRHGMAGRTIYQGDVPIIFPGPKGGWLDVSGESARWTK